MDKYLDFEILYKDMLVAHIVYNRSTRKLVVTQFTDHIFYRQFKQKEITMKHIAVWLENRCFPKERANSDQLLAALGLSEYYPLSIVKKTHGLQMEDYFWVRFKGEELQYNDIKIRD